VKERALLGTFHHELSITKGLGAWSGDEVGIEPYSFASVQASHLVHLLHTHTHFSGKPRQQFGGQNAWKWRAGEQGERGKWVGCNCNMMRKGKKMRPD
jgi:hypothetical protein